MAAQNNFLAQMLILAICLASALASTSTRDPKELRIFRLSDSSSYRVPSTQFRNGVTQRQISSLINPLIGQQGLGPFFGYFPNFLTQPCPECKNDTVCEPPVLPPPGNITGCSGQFSTPGSAAQNGTISLNVKLNFMTGCYIFLVSFYPKTNIQLNCDTFGKTTEAKVGLIKLKTESVIMAPKTNYVSQENTLLINFVTTDVLTNIVAECTWTNIPA